jgi:DNA-binding transcriptional LysR family regulator
MELKAIDLNLLVVFEAVFRERSVTKAGDRLGLSQPALSHALNRLRWRLNDRLFVRTPNGMLPTPRAEELAPPIRRALSELQAALEPEEFVASEADRRFTIAVNNYAAVVLAGPITAEVTALAPNIRLSLRPAGTLDLPDLLDRGELDLAIAASDPSAERFASRLLAEDRYVVAMRRGHPALLDELDLAAFAALSNLVISSSGEDLGFVDAALGGAGHVRRVGLEAPYLSAGAILVQSDMVAVLGSQIAREFRRAYPIELRELPFKSRALRSVMLWHKRFDAQPAHRWLREMIIATARNLLGS